MAEEIVLPLNPIDFADMILDAIRKDLPEEMIERISFRKGREMEQEMKKTTNVLTCLPGTAKVIKYGSNFFEHEVPYFIECEAREFQSNYEAYRRAYKIVWEICLATINENSHFQALVREVCGQDIDPTGIEPIYDEGNVTGRVGFGFSLLHYTEYNPTYPPVSKAIKSLYRYETEEYIEGETIELEPEGD